MMISASLLAQPSIQYPQNAPKIGDITEIQFVSPTGLSFNSAGPNVTWDFSQLTELSGASISAIDPADAPAGNLFPQANIALKLNDSTYSYCLIDETGFFYLGAQLSFSGYPITMIYSDHRRYIRYPFDYLDTENDLYKGVSSMPPTEIRVTGDSEVIADAYGSLILPYGTYHDVLRLTTIDVEIDSIFAQNIFISEISVTRAQFHWYGQNSASPLFSIEIIEGAGPTDTVAYYATTGAGIADVTKGPISQLNIYPNPAEDHVMISFESSRNEVSTISIVNQLGQLMLSSKTPKNNIGTINESFDISSLPSGLYFVNISCSCGKQLTEKFVVR